MKRSTPLVGLAVLTALALTACSGSGDPSSSGTSGGQPVTTTLTLGAQGDITSFDPALANEGMPMPFYQAVYDTLLLREPNGDLSPMLATEWSYNDDNTVLTLELRDDIAFDDGTPFNADAVKANLEHFKAGNGPQASTVASVSEVTAVDDDTVEITLSQPDPAFETSLSNAAGLMANPASLSSPDLASTPDGTGPYVLDKNATVTGSQYTYTKREDYWNPDLQKFETVVIKPMADLTSRLNALISGQIDAAALNASTAAQAEGAGLTLVPYQVNWSGLVLADRAGTVVPALADVRVRQAFNYAIDGDQILEELNGGLGDPTTQVFNPQTNAYVEELDDAYPYDPEKAKELLAEAGYADGFDVDIPYGAGIWDPAQLAVITEQLGEVGIRANFVSIPLSTVATEQRSGKYGVIIINLFEPSTWRTVSQVLSSESAINIFKTNDPVAEEMIATLRLNPDDAETAQKLNEYVVENAWFNPWYRLTVQYFTGPKVTTEAQLEQSVPSLYNYAPVTK